MDGEALSRLDRLIWVIVAIVAVIVVTAPLVSHFQIGWDTFIAPVLACTILWTGGRFYAHWRRDPRLASALLCTAQVIAFAAVGAPLSYIAATANAPLWDHGLAVIDRALGLDWKALLGWMNASPAIYALLRPIYLSLTLQMTTVVLCLAFSGRFLWLRVYNLAFIIAVLTSIAVSAVLPAAGAWPYYGLTGADSQIVPAVSPSWPVFYGLRDGTFRLLVAVGSEGIITFPSVHAALAVIVVIALWPIAILRWAFLVLNAAMLAATPIDGSHYFVDVLAGIALALLSLLLAQSIAARVASPAPHAREIAQGAG
jgi:uncharacterized membrane protein